MTELTEKQQTWLEQLIFDGHVTAIIPILQDKVKLELVSIDGETQLSIEGRMKDKDGTALEMLHTYAINTLGYTIKKIITDREVKAFANPDEAIAYIKTRPTAFIDAMIKAQSDFEKELKFIATGEAVENFTQPQGTVAASGTTPKA